MGTMRDSMLEIWEDISSDEDDGNDNKGADDDIQLSNGCIFRSGHGWRGSMRRRREPRNERREHALTDTVPIEYK
jgi:hypothetical protein